MADPATTTWRALTWNILGARQPDLSAIAAVVSDLEPDVVGLQEVQRRQVRKLARHLGWHYAWARKHYPYTPLVWWRAEGIAIISPWVLSARMRTTISPGISTWIYKHRVLLALSWGLIFVPAPLIGAMGAYLTGRAPIEDVEIVDAPWKVPGD